MDISTAKFNQVKKEIRKIKKVLILVHRAPDGDAIGSALALKNFLEKQKKEVFIFIPQPPQFLKFLPGFKTLQKKLPDNFNFDLIFALDYADIERLEIPSNIKLYSQKIITFDHHLSGKRIGKIRIIDPKASSTAEIVYLFLKSQKIKIDKNLATLILTGVLTDTVGFCRSSQRHQKVEKIIGELILAGAELFKIMSAYQHLDLKRAKILAKLLERIEKDENLNLIYSYLLMSDFKGERGLNLSEPPIFPDFLASIGDAEIYVFLIEQKHKIKVSLRSYNGVNVSKIAQKFGGGGHKYAAGCKVEGEIFDVLKKIKKEIKSYKTLLKKY